MTIATKAFILAIDCEGPGYIVGGNNSQMLSPCMCNILFLFGYSTFILVKGMRSVLPLAITITTTKNINQHLISSFS